VARFPRFVSTRRTANVISRIEGRARDLAMFNLAIDSKLRGCDVVAIRVEDVAASGYAADFIKIRESPVISDSCVPPFGGEGVRYWWGTGGEPVRHTASELGHPQRLRSPRHSVHPVWKVGCFSVSLTVSIQCA
jgi:hypothetical protein